MTNSKKPVESSSADLKFLTWALAGDGVEHLRKAGKKCRALLKERPDNAAFLHLLGVIEFKLGHLDLASASIRKGLELLPGSAEMHCLYAQILAAQKKFDEAIDEFRRSVVLKPNHAKAYYGLGTVFGELGDVTNEVKAYNDALAIDPNYAEALNNLGITLKNRGALDEAAACFTRALAARPDYAFALNNLGFIYFTLGNTDAAEGLYRRALALKPDYPDALNNLGILLHRRGALDESVSLITKALALRPDYPDALSNLGMVLSHKGAFAESILLYRKALVLQPKHPEALNNLGNALKNTGHLSDAIAAYEQALALKGCHPEYHNNHAMALLAAGKFDEGWREYEWRWKTALFADAKHETAKPRWQGEAAQGRALLIRAEQGFGDTLQFCRYAPLAADRGMRVVLEVQPGLVELMKSLTVVEQVIAQGRALPEFDLYCPMMSLPLAFDTRLETIPAHIPYLAVNAERAETWKTRLSNDEKKLKVGLVWAGSSRIHSPDLVAADRRRSIDPELLAPLMDIAGIQFYSLQKAGPAAPEAFGLIDLMDGCNDFNDTAALIVNLDLVISVDTAVAHLAGALGKPVWILNRFDSCWRWLQNRDDSPWYPTLRLFRQTSTGDWKSIVSNVGNELWKVSTNGISSMEVSGGR